LLVDDRDPPHAPSATLPQSEAQLDPAVVRPKSQRGGRPASALGTY
jgi:hypothetical protein